MKHLFFTIMIVLSIIFLEGCNSIKYDDCDCVIVTKKMKQKEGNHKWFIELEDYCAKKRIEPTRENFSKEKYNETLKKCTG